MDSMQHVWNPYTTIFTSAWIPCNMPGIHTLLFLPVHGFHATCLESIHYYFYQCMDSMQHAWNPYTTIFTSAWIPCDMHGIQVGCLDSRRGPWIPGPWISCGF